MLNVAMVFHPFLPWNYSASVATGAWSFSARAASLGIDRAEVEEYKTGRLAPDRRLAIEQITQRAIDALRESPTMGAC